MVWQAIAGAAASIVGSALSKRSSSEAAKNSVADNGTLMNYQAILNENAANADYNRNIALMNKSYLQNLDLMNQSNAFQELMSNTAHQREMSDLKAAGLNPILAANSGAYNSFGSSASVGIANSHSNGASIGSLSRKPTDFDFNGALQFFNDSKRVKNETSLANENVRNIKSQVRLNDSNTALAFEQAKTEMDKQQQIKTDIANSIKQTNADVYAKIKNADSGYITANANSINARTNSSRLNHQINVHNNSDEHLQQLWYKHHPVINELHRVGNFFGGNNPAQLIKGSIFRIH